VRATRQEKLETIRLVEESELSVTRTLQELEVPRSTFYRWYQAYLEDGCLEPKPVRREQFWNRIPDADREKVVEEALARPELSPRELAWRITDREGVFLSESSVYRILKAYDLVASPAYVLISAKDRFDHPTRRVHELWQTDFTYCKVVGWGWYYLLTVLDDYSRYILGWKLFTGMSSGDVTEVLDAALERTGVDRVEVHHRPRLLSDNVLTTESRSKDKEAPRGPRMVRGSSILPCLRCRCGLPLLSDPRLTIVNTGSAERS